MPFHKQPHISIIIPVKNGVQTLSKCLHRIQEQTLFQQAEIIIIDSGSTDGTLALLSNFPDVKLYKTAPESFNHGATRNYGISIANGDFVVMTVQDACPADNFWLENLFQHFKDNKVAGVCGQQVVPHHKDKNPHEWFRPVSKPSVREYYFADKSFEILSPSEKNKVCSWDNVTAMYRRSALLAVPFSPVLFGEDMLWAKNALLEGYKLVYDSSARVEHYHHVDYEYMYKRTLTSVYYRYKNFMVKPNQLIKKVDYLKVIYRNIKYGASLNWIPYNWIAFKAYNKALCDFHKHLSTSEKGLDNFYYSTCTNVPLAKARKNEPTLS